MRASILIASYNERGLLARTLRSCLDTTDGLDCEVIVADDASSDGTVRDLAGQFERVRFVEHACRRGVAPTKDLAARVARGDVLVFLDGHCKPEDGAIARLVVAVEGLGGRGVVTPRIATLDSSAWENDPNQCGHGYYLELDSFGIGWIDLEHLRPYDGVAVRPLYAQPTFIGCCAAMGRDLYACLRGFDTGMRTYGSEDVDFGLKAWLMGYPVLHDPAAVIGHRFRTGFDGYAVPEEHLLVNQLRMARKHFTDPTWFSWLDRFSARYPADFWETVWSQYLDGYESLERERAYLMANRVRDEFWYAAAFGMAWPGRGPERQARHPSVPPIPLIAASAIPSSASGAMPSNGPGPPSGTLPSSAGGKRGLSLPPTMAPRKFSLPPTMAPRKFSLPPTMAPRKFSLPPSQPPKPTHGASPSSPTGQSSSAP